jgi:acylphosphatase
MYTAMSLPPDFSYNLGGSAENDNDKSVRFILQGVKERIDQALKAIRKGTKKSSNVNVNVSPAQLDPNLKTFTVVGWTSVSRHTSHLNDLVFNLRREDTGKCDKDGD